MACWRGVDEGDVRGGGLAVGGCKAAEPRCGSALVIYSCCWKQGVAMLLILLLRWESLPAAITFPSLLPPPSPLLLLWLPTPSFPFPSPPNRWAPFFPPLSFPISFFFYFFFPRASVTNANTCRSRGVKPCRISVASATLPRSNPVVIPLPAHPRRLCPLFKGSKWDR